MDRLWLFAVAVSVAFLGVALVVLGYVFYAWSKTSAVDTTTATAQLTTTVTSSPQTTTTTTAHTATQSPQPAQVPTVAVRRFYVVDVEETPMFVAEIESDSDGVVLRLTCGDARGDAALVKGVNKVVLPLAGRRQTLAGGVVCVVKAYHQNAEVYSGEVKLAGASAEVELVDYGGDIAFFGQLYTPGLVFKRLVIEVKNTGDVPIYICDSGCLPQIAVYINGEYAKAALQNSLVLNPGEKGRLTLTTAPVRISQNKTLVEVRLGTTTAKFAVDFSDFFALESAVLFSQRVEVDGWDVAAVNITEASYVQIGGTVYRAEEHMKFVAIRISARNIDREPRPLGDLWGFKLVTTAGKGYDPATTLKPARGMGTSIAPYNPSVAVQPGEVKEFDVLFQIPQDEYVWGIRFRIGRPPNTAEVGVKRRVGVIEARDIIAISDKGKSG